MSLSIIVPIYDVEPYLEECLSSVQAALRFPAYAEVLCVDDGSTDSSGKIAQRFAQSDSRFRVITQVNGGYGKAINTGMAAARGEYVTIVESDDIIAGNVYQDLLEILRRDTSLDFIKTPYQPFTVDGKQPLKGAPPKKQTATDILAAPPGKIRPKTFLSDKLLLQPPAIWSAIYRRSSLERFNITLPETPGAGYQDTCFSAMCFLNGMTYHWVADRYYMYRVDRETASRHACNRRSEIVTLFRFVRENLERNDNMTSMSKPHFYAVYFRRLIWFMQRVRKDHQFTLFFDAYRDFSEVWESPKLRRATSDLLPEGEGVQFEHFFQGRQGKLYA